MEYDTIEAPVLPEGILPRPVPLNADELAEQAQDAVQYEDPQSPVDLGPGPEDAILTQHGLHRTAFDRKYSVSAFTVAVKVPNLAALLALLASPTLPDYTVDVSAPDTHEGMAAVHWAALSGDLDSLAALCNAKANLDVRCLAGETPLHKAAKMVRCRYIPAPNPSPPSNTVPLTSGPLCGDRIFGTSWRFALPAVHERRHTTPLCCVLRTRGSRRRPCGGRRFH